MARQAKKAVVNLTVTHTPIPADRVFAWRAGCLLLLELLRERRYVRGSEKEYGHKRIDRDRGTRGIGTSLLPLAHVDRKEAPKTGSVYAWFVGHDGSLQRMAYGPQ